MATDIERLVVQMSADLRGFENAMAKATGVSRAQLKLIKAEAESAGTGAEAAFAGASRGVRSYGNSASVAAKQAGALRAQTGNLAAQFQDIAVQLQMGQNPFQIALQQGTQISAVLGGQGARGAVAALGGAFASLVSPVSLVTIGLIAAGGAAVQYFSGLTDDGAKSKEELKQQGDAIKRIADEWGDAIPALRAYVDEIEAAARAQDAATAKDVVIGDIWGDAREQTQAMTVDVNELVNKLQTLGAAPEQVVALQRSFSELETKVADGTAQIKDADAVTDALAALIQSIGVPAVTSFSNAFGVLANSIAIASSQARTAEADFSAAAGAARDFAAAQAMRDSTREVLQDQKDFTAEIERRNGLTKEQIALEDEAVRIRKEAERSGTVINQQEADRLALQTIEAENRRAEAARAARSAGRSGGGGGGGGAARASEVDREREAVVKLIEALEFEQSLVGLTNEQKEIQNALRRAGAAATEEERAKIEQIVSATYAQNEALRANEEAMERLKGLSRDVLGGMFEDLRDGASAADVLANALNRVAESMVKAGIDQLIAGAFSGGGATGGLLGGRIIPGILHGGGTAGVDGYGHGRSFPASTWANAQRFHTGGMVGGLRAGEVPAILQKGETVIPRGGSGGTVQVQLSLTDDIDARIVQVSGPVAVQVVKRTGPGVMADAQRRSG